MPTTTMATSAGSYPVDATEPVPGLYVYQTPDHVSPLSPFRWLLAHWDGPALASFETADDAAKAAEVVKPLADWSRNAMTVANEISFGGKVKELGRLLTAAGGLH